MTFGSGLRIAIMVGVFLGLIYIVRKVCAAEADRLLDLLKRGSRLEFTTRPGALSFMTFVVICVLCFMFASYSELLTGVYDLFNVQAADQKFSASQAMAWAFCTLLLNFIFVAWMRGGTRRR
jgi:hypothetical protein